MNTKRSKGIVFIILSALSFAFMGLFVRMSGELPSIQKSFFRNLIAFLVTFMLLLRDKGNMKVRKGDLKYLILRSTFGTVGIFCNFYALDHLVISDASMLNKLSPFFVIVFSFFILKERVKFFQGAMVVLAFIGAVFIVKPTGDFNNLPALAGIVGGMTAGAAYTMVRLMGKRGVNGKVIIAFFSGFSCLSCVPFLVCCFQKMEMIQVMYLILAGLAATGGQFAITRAYFYAPAKEISIYDYSNIMFSALLGFFVLGQVPDIYSLAGYVIICMAAVIMFIYNSRQDMVNQKAGKALE